MRVKRLSIMLAALVVIFLFGSAFLIRGCVRREESEVIAEEEEAVIEDEKEEAVEEIKEEAAEEVKEEPKEDIKTEDEVKKEAEDPRVYAAILKNIDFNNNLIEIEQLINEPHERVLDSKLKLAEGFKVYRNVVVRDEQGENEYTKEISLKEIPIGVEIGVKLTGDFVSIIIYPENVEGNGPYVEEIKPHEGEYFVNAILKSKNSNMIVVEQLINEPNEKIIDPDVRLAEGFKVYRNILIRKEDTEKEYTKEISLKDVAIETEIGIIFAKDNFARTIISFEMFEG